MKKRNAILICLIALFSAQVFCLDFETAFAGKTVQECIEIVIEDGTKTWNYIYGISEIGNVRSVFSFKAKLPEKPSPKVLWDFWNKFSVRVYFPPLTTTKEYEGIVQIVLSKDGYDDFECTAKLWGFPNMGWMYSDYDLTGKERLRFPEEFYDSEVTVKIKLLENNFPEQLQDVFFLIAPQVTK